MRYKDREKFKMLAENRVNAALKAVRLVGNLANKSNYDYSENDVKKIFGALEESIADCKARFAFASKQKNEAKFTLD